MSSGMSEYFQQLAAEWRQSDAYKRAIKEGVEYCNLLDEIWKKPVSTLNELTIREFMVLINMTMCDVGKMIKSDEPDLYWREEARKLDYLNNLRKLHEKLCK